MRLLLALPLLFALPAFAATPTTSPATKPAVPLYFGTFEYRYPGNIAVRCEVNDDTHLKWTILAGGEIGKSATEQVDRREVADGVFFTSWTEANGTMVAQVANYRTMKLATVLIFNGNRLMLDGTITRVGQ